MQQISLFDLPDIEEPEPTFDRILDLGDSIAKVVLGECRIATVTQVEGLPFHPFYRTDKGICYDYEDGLKTVEALIKQAEEARAEYITIEPKNLTERIAVEYAPRQCDGKVQWAQIGIYNNMLFWKESITYQFLEYFDDEKKLRKEYNKRKADIMNEKNCGKFTVVEDEKPMERLYRSRRGFYATAEYVRSNG